MDDARHHPRVAAWAAFRRLAGVRVGLTVLTILALAGIYAPFIANESALLWRDGSGWQAPILGELFNRNSFPKIYDLLFNIIALVLPLILCIGWWRRWSWLRRLGVTVAVSAGLGLILVIPFRPGIDGWTGLWRGAPLTTQTLSAYHKNPALAEVAIFTPFGHSWIATYPGESLRPPMRVNASTGRVFVLGSDLSGRDVLAQMIYGARISLTIGFVVTGLSMLIGILIGVASGYLGGKIDLILQRVVEVMMCFPTFILILVVVAALGRDIFIIMVVMGLTGWAEIARLVRGEVLVQTSRDYVMASQSLGLGQWRIMLAHVLPNCMTPLLITAVFGVAGAVLGEAGLSFVGLGDTNTPSWGVLLDQGRENMKSAWLIWTPGIAIFLLVTALYQVGNGLRTVFDPKAAR